jgi:transcriptional regulator with XRE-family HTH domain
MTMTQSRTETMGGRLRAARLFAGIEQAQLAAEIGCARGSISNWEGDRNDISAKALIKWAELTRVSLDWLAWGTQKAPSEDGASGSVRPEGFEPPTY